MWQNFKVKLIGDLGRYKKTNSEKYIKYYIGYIKAIYSIFFFQHLLNFFLP